MSPHRGNWTGLNSRFVRGESKAAHGATSVSGEAVIRSGTPFVDERRDDDANAEEHGDVNPLTVSYSRCTEHQYESDGDEESRNLGFCANEAVRVFGGLL
ncbi:hypothetical protein GCM10028857_30090 [Salinarchaeum chitinilyticum]